MKKIVVYKTSTGFTKRYAEWIAQALGCEEYSTTSRAWQLVAELPKESQAAPHDAPA